MKYVEQNGNVFLENNGEYKYIPRTVEQNGNIFKFNSDKMDYEFVSPVMKADTKEDTRVEALKTGIEKGVSFGASPAIAGLGAGAGALIGSLQSGSPLSEAIRKAKESYSEAKDEYNVRAAKLQRENPLLSLTGNIAGSIATAPLMPVKTMGQALKAGAAAGLGESIGSAESLKEAGENIIGGALTGGAIKVGGDVVGKGISKGIDLVKRIMPEKLLAKIASTTTGISERDIKTYAKNLDEINSEIKKYKGDIPLAVDEAKQQISNKIAIAKSDFGKQIEKGLDSISPEIQIPVEPLINKLESIKSQLNRVTKAGEINQIDEFIGTINKLSTDGSANPRDYYAIYKYLQDNSGKSFVKNGQIFANDVDVSRAAKEAYKIGKDVINNLSPGIKDANNKFYQLHRIEDVMNSNLIGVGKPEGAFLQAVSGENLRNERLLKKLGALTGQDIIGQGEKISAMRSFSNPNLLPQGERTGYALGRIGTGAGLGYGIAKLTDTDPTTGAAIGAAMTGPTALKAAINAGNISGKAINEAINKLNDPMVRATMIQTFGKKNIDDEKLDAMQRRLKTMK